MMRRISAAPLLMAVLLLAATAMAAQGPFNVHQLHSLRRLQSFDVSPSGQIVYDLRVWCVGEDLFVVLRDESSGTKTTSLYANGPNSGFQILTQQLGKSDFSPKFTPSGRHVAFLSTRSGSSQLWTVSSSLSSNQPTQFTNYPVDIDSFKWVTPGYFVFSAQVYIDCPDLACTAQRNAAQVPTAGLVYDELFVRHWDVFITPNKVSHIFLQRVQQTVTGEWALIGEPVDLMKGMKANSPVPPDGGSDHYDISPDGSKVAFCAGIVNRKQAWTTGWRTFVVNISPSISAPIDISASVTQARTQNPKFSPDGRTLAILAMDRPGFEADRLHLGLFDTSSYAFRTLANKWDRSVSGFTFSADSSQLYVDADDDGYHKLFLINRADESVTELMSTGDNINVIVSPRNASDLFFLRHSFMAPTDIYRITIDERWAIDKRSITNVNADILANIALVKPVNMKYQSVNGSTVQAWFLPPYGWTPGKSFPLAQLVHGGPQGAWNDAWSYRWNPQLWAARGYAVIMPNPRGSTGFGQAWTDAVSGDWGGAPFLDVMNSLDAILKNNTWIDSNRVCACGASYGGFMMNWLNSQTKGTYKCLVTHDGVFDALAMYYSTDELWFEEWEQGGTPYNVRANYEKFNPANFVGQWQTPALIVHGGKDFRIPISQGIGAFTALQRRGIPSKLLYFPEENHWVTAPTNGIMWYDNVLTWLDQWTQNVPPKKY